MVPEYKPTYVLKYSDSILCTSFGVVVLSFLMTNTNMNNTLVMYILSTLLTIVSLVYLYMKHKEK